MLNSKTNCDVWSSDFTVVSSPIVVIIMGTHRCYYFLLHPCLCNHELKLLLSVYEQRNDYRAKKFKMFCALTTSLAMLYGKGCANIKL